MASSSLWQRFQKYFLYYRDLDCSLDISRMKFAEDFFEKMQPHIENRASHPFFSAYLSRSLPTPVTALRADPRP
jgi:hypothetical protein